MVLSIQGFQKALVVHEIQENLVALRFQHLLEIPFRQEHHLYLVDPLHQILLENLVFHLRHVVLAGLDYPLVLEHLDHPSILESLGSQEDLGDRQDQVVQAHQRFHLCHANQVVREVLLFLFHLGDPQDP